MTDEEIISESFLFFFAGFDTSSSTTTFAIWELSRNPEYQEKVRQEINGVLEKHNGELSYEALSEMAYLDMVIKGNCLKLSGCRMTNYAIFLETLRMYPIVTVIPRKCTKNYKIPGTDVIVEKGINLSDCLSRYC